MHQRKKTELKIQKPCKNQTRIRWTLRHFQQTWQTSQSCVWTQDGWPASQPILWLDTKWLTRLTVSQVESFPITGLICSIHGQHRSVRPPSVDSMEASLSTLGATQRLHTEYTKGLWASLHLQRSPSALQTTLACIWRKCLEAVPLWWLSHLRPGPQHLE